ncbi:hypothetical protein [Kitasatospora purpeofusca]|uniref:hypothetical protein n=1 Tax=Kitasatospora purpeofusca TaxID=67352 RepID=UPI002A59D6AB|nr:hypothetical protein [Kitasatospora purpeofusca]MDY0811640.1 hypothetical protein [Kitasatospora purpeofusca]
MSQSFDESVLIEIAYLICGDDSPLLYRKGYEIAEFLRRAKWEDVPDPDGTPRHQWTLGLLRERQEEDEGDALKAVLRLADQREYVGQPREYKATVARLDEVLALEGWRIGYAEGQPILVPVEAGADESVRMPRVELQVSVSQVISDPALAAAVQTRLDEAHTCYEHGAYTAAVIMLGSLLEGVLVHVAQVRAAARAPRKRPEELGLKDLVDLAHDNGWIEHDAKLASDLVRHYRNLVHPAAERRTGHGPNRDTVDMCWPIVNATLNDLAATASAAPARPAPSDPPISGANRPTPASVARPRRPSGPADGRPSRSRTAAGPARPTTNPG